MLKRKQLFGLVVSVAVLLLTLIAVQLYWLQNSYRLNEKNFNEKVDRALVTATKDIDKQLFSYFLYSRSYIAPNEGVFLMKVNTDNGKVDSLPLFNAFPYPDKPDTCFYSTNISYFDRPVLADVSLRFEYLGKGNDGDFNERNELIKKLTLANYGQVLEDTGRLRMALGVMDSMVAKAMRAEGLEGKFAYGIRKGDSGPFVYSSAADPGLLAKAGHKARLFTNSSIAAPYMLYLSVANEERTKLAAMNWLLFLSCAIITGLIIVFIYFFRIVLRQRKLSEMKTDFINNMTHEFMTPVTNIGLAIETIERGNGNGSTHQLLGLIASENAHLRDNINKVLQVATLEKGNFQTEITNVNVHETLRRVVKSFDLSIAAKQGKVQIDLQAAHHIVSFDETHLINLFYNIIDNAIKYASAERPLQIRISTNNIDRKLVISITDNGIGMSPGVQQQIFNKFYRASKGNRHDVKGFGLGLNYVKTIADAYALKIEVDSSESKGTSFTITMKL